MSETYAEYLESPGWRTKARIMKELAQETCEACGRQSVRPLHVHHLHYDSVGDESPRDLVVLCGDCHTTAHREGWDLELIALHHAPTFEDNMLFEYRRNGWIYDFVPEPRYDRLPGEMES